MITEMEGTTEILANFEIVWGYDVTFLYGLFGLYIFV